MKEIKLVPKVLSRGFSQFYRKNPSKPLSVVRICDYPTRCKWSSKRFPEDLLGRPTSSSFSLLLLSSQLSILGQLARVSELPDNTSVLSMPIYPNVYLNFTLAL